MRSPAPALFELREIEVARSALQWDETVAITGAELVI